MPLALLNSYAEMLPRLKAERDIRMMNVIGAGTGSLKKAAHQRFVRRLEREARGSESHAHRDPWGLGIPVIEEAAGG